MENNPEQLSTFTIALPEVGEELELAKMHIQAWKETYTPQEPTLTVEKVDELLGHMLTNTDFRRKTILEALADSHKTLYKVVKNENGRIVGFMHADRDEQYNNMNAIYLLNEAKGSGIGSELMKHFIAWHDTTKPTRLEVLSFNEPAIHFYEKHGFRKTDTELELYKGFLPIFEMIRPADK